MRFYHYTSTIHLPLILNDKCLSRGDVPITPNGGFNAVWVTAKKTVQHRWTFGSAVDKTAVCIEIEIPDDDPLLEKWTDVIIREDMNPEWAQALNKKNDFMNWFIYKGKISSDWFLALTVDGNTYTPKDIQA